eukprot:CAMPEP_0179037818 /NCGR_PEP_ID=MMETSP0796-20121207/14320_1 /TAXON_ID=73915 /ORGANISM="Pyrodinium bahamense, Strain pbaha01" /LENGTH=176 /DNA_ID=CAMNT_0020734129 /DNA_START=226 /DNA_END=753 /DNA_ORIENTATION=-
MAARRVAESLEVFGDLSWVHGANHLLEGRDGGVVDRAAAHKEVSPERHTRLLELKVCIDIAHAVQHRITHGYDPPTPLHADVRCLIRHFGDDEGHLLDDLHAERPRGEDLGLLLAIMSPEHHGELPSHAPAPATGASSATSLRRSQPRHWDAQESKNERPRGSQPLVEQRRPEPNG